MSNLITKSNAVRKFLIVVVVLVSLAMIPFTLLMMNGFDTHRMVLEVKNDVEQAIYGWDYYNPELMELNIDDELADLREGATDSASLNGAACASAYRHMPAYEAGVRDIASDIGVQLMKCSW